MVQTSTIKYHQNPDYIIDLSEISIGPTYKNKTLNEYNSQIRGIAFPQVRPTFVSRPL